MSFIYFSNRNEFCVKNQHTIHRKVRFSQHTLLCVLNLLLINVISWHMTRHHRSLTRTPRQQRVRSRSSLYHTPPQRSPLANSVEPFTSDNETTVAAEERRPQTRRNQGLKEHLQKQLLKDIEDNGGLRVFSLARLVNEKSDTYGEVDSTLRRQVQNCVDRWKRHTDSEYLLLLNYFGVRAASLQSSFYPSHRLASTTVEVIPETDTHIRESTSLPFKSSLLERDRSSSSQFAGSQQINERQSSYPTQTFTSPSRYSRHLNMNTNALALRPMAGINDGFEGKFASILYHVLQPDNFLTVLSF